MSASMLPSLSLSGRTALVTGGSKGLGRAIATAFVEAGANVVLLARTQRDLESAAAELAAHAAGPDGIRTFACDVSDPAAIAAVADALRETPVDILVNNAGEARAMPFEQASDADWQTDIDQKLMAAVRLCRTFMPAMRERRWGRVINLLNIAAKAPGANSAPTSVTRAAGMALTKVLSKEYAPHNVLVNGINVGLVDSDQWRRSHAALPDTADGAIDYATFLARLGQRVPLGRVGELREAAALALFLASEAGSFVTGCAINLDGGMAQTV